MESYTEIGKAGFPGMHRAGYPMACDAGVREASLRLDRDAPGWHRRIDLFALQMLDPRYCIIGQTYGGSRRRYLSYGINSRRIASVPPVLYDMDISWVFVSSKSRWIREIELRRKIDEAIKWNIETGNLPEPLTRDSVELDAELDGILEEAWKAEERFPVHS